MKTRLLITAVMLVFTISLSAQYCGNSGSAVCTPSGTITEAGLMKSEDIPCIRRNTNTDIVIQFKNYDQFYYNGIPITIDSLRFDSIGNLPAGLCWSTNKATNTYNNSEDGCIRITGSTNAQPGQYKLKLYITMNTSIGTIGPNLDAETVGINVYIRVLNNNGSICPAVDTNQVVAFAEFPANLDSVAHITGTVYIDRNSNSQLDANDTRISNARISIGNEEVITNSNGVYNFYMPAGNYVVSPTDANPDIYTFSPASIAVSAPNIGVEYGNKNFTVSLPAGYCQGTLHAVGTSTPPRPGFYNTMLVGYRNDLSESAVSTTFRLKFDTLQSFVSASPSPNFVDTVAGVLEWSISNLATGSEWVAFLNMYTPQTAVLGTILTNSLSLSNSTCNSLDSLTFDYEEEIVGSYDPNDKAVSPVGYGSWNGVNPDKNPEFTYKIRFQNTGTYLAENVVIVDTISQHLDLATLKVLGASHSYEVSVGQNRAVKFIFNQIMLPDSNSNEPGSHGYVQYVIKPYTGLSQNVEITNRADIYFDFNEPILTNTTLTTVDYNDYTVGINDAPTTPAFKIFPNPTTGNVQIAAEEQLLGKELRLTDVSGRILLQRIVDAPLLTISLTDLANGIYLLQIDGATKKLVKE